MTLTSILSGGVDKIIDSVGNGLDKLFTSDEEKLILSNELEKVRLKAKEQAMLDSAEFEKEITQRWKSDNEHTVTRLVRPLSFVFVLFIFGLIVLTDGNIGEFKVNTLYIPVIESLLSVMVMAYFGSRGLEKIAKVKYSEK